MNPNWGIQLEVAIQWTLPIAFPSKLSLLLIHSNLLLPPPHPHSCLHYICHPWAQIYFPFQRCKHLAYIENHTNWWRFQCSTFYHAQSSVLLSTFCVMHKLIHKIIIFSYCHETITISPLVWFLVWYANLRIKVLAFLIVMEQLWHPLPSIHLCKVVDVLIQWTCK
jgi:hypothetical protein